MGKRVTGATLLAVVLLGPTAMAQRARPGGPLVHTCSIVARDPRTGDMDVAVQSHWFSAGSIVTWGEAGVGGVATQSFVDPGYGPRALELLRAGTSAPEALEQLVAADAARDGRQVAILDAAGRVDAYTGKTAIAAAGDVIGGGVSAQANLMGTDAVWPAMLRAWYRAGSQLAPEVLELAFMHAVTLASVGREAEAVAIFRAVFAKEPQWVELLGRLPAAGLFPDDAALLLRTRSLARRPGGE